jgi:Phage tail tube protein, GTA-gp10
MSPPILLNFGGQSIAFRPSYAALVSAEADVGSLFALVECASNGALKLHDMIALLWHCRVDTPASLSLDAFGALCVEAGLSHITPVFRALIEQALGGA